MIKKPYEIIHKAVIVKKEYTIKIYIAPNKPRHHLFEYSSLALSYD